MTSNEEIIRKLYEVAGTEPNAGTILLGQLGVLGNLGASLRQ